jgi:hypothetical protein
MLFTILRQTASNSIRGATRDLMEEDDRALQKFKKFKKQGGYGGKEKKGGFNDVKFKKGKEEKRGYGGKEKKGMKRDLKMKMGMKGMKGKGH